MKKILILSSILLFSASSYAVANDIFQSKTEGMENANTPVALMNPTLPKVVKMCADLWHELDNLRGKQFLYCEDNTWTAEECKAIEDRVIEVKRLLKYCGPNRPFRDTIQNSQDLEISIE